MLNPDETAKDRMDWEHSHHNQIKKVLSRLGFKRIKTASPDDDMKRATDFTAVYCGKDCHIACRLRRDENGMYRDLTIRKDTDFGKNKSELDKIQDGMVEMYFYGWVSEGVLVDWMLVNVQIMRTNHLIYVPDGTSRNVGKDQKSFAYWHDETLWKSGCTIAQKSRGIWNGIPDYKEPTLVDAQKVARSVRMEQREKYELLCRFFPLLPRDDMLLYSYIPAE